MREIRVRTSFRPRPLPSGRWAMTQRWNDLLFAHWPVSASQMGPLLPEGLQVDTFNGSAWLGVVPFWMDRIKVRGIPPIPGARSFPELNLRTYVRDQHTGTPGVYFFSLDASNLLAVAAARTFYHLPYHWAEMRLDERSEREFSFYSRRRLSSSPVVFKAHYRGPSASPCPTASRCSTIPAAWPSTSGLPSWCAPPSAPAPCLRLLRPRDNHSPDVLSGSISVPIMRNESARTRAEV